MWLTQLVKPFLFKNESAETLPYREADSLYVHIPFCTSICNFCPYYKELYEREKCDRYIDALIREIHLL